MWLAGFALGAVAGLLVGFVLGALFVDRTAREYPWEG